MLDFQDPFQHFVPALFCYACRSESRWGQDEVLHFLQTCLDDIDQDMLSENTSNGELLTPSFF